MPITTTNVTLADKSFANGEQPKEFSRDMMITETTTMVISANGEAIYTKEDFEDALKKVSKRRESFFGENIRDTVKAIKGKQS